jgi:hypothetical protein
MTTRVAISSASVWEKPAEHREDGEDRRPDEEGAPAPEHVRQAAPGDEQDAEGQGVGVHHPLGGGDAGVEVLLDLRDRDVDGGEVVRQHEGREAHRDQRQPGSAGDRRHPAAG